MGNQCLSLDLAVGARDTHVHAFEVYVPIQANP